MPCPYFLPVRRLERVFDGPPPRLPLGDPYAGFCRAQPDSFEPPESHQRELCNFGYARGRCAQFPAQNTADAIRFSVTEDTPDRLNVVFVIEAANSPIQHGSLGYDVSAAKVESSAAGDMCSRQAECFAESYLRQRRRTG